MKRIFVTVVVAALVAVACGGGSSNSASKPSPAGDFADATCTDLAAWASSIQTAFNDLTNISSLDVNDRAEVSTVIAKLKTSLGGAETATAGLAKGIGERPAPSISSGSDVKKVLVDGFNGLRDLLSSTLTKLNAFDPNTATAEQATQLKTDLGNLEGEALTKVAGVSVLSDNEDLRKAFEGSQTCKDASSGLVSDSS